MAVIGLTRLTPEETQDMAIERTRTRPNPRQGHRKSSYRVIVDLDDRTTTEQLQVIVDQLMAAGGDPWTMRVNGRELTWVTEEIDGCEFRGINFVVGSEHMLADTSA